MVCSRGKRTWCEPVRIIGGAYDCCFRAGMQFYNGINSIEEGRERDPDIIHNSGNNLGIPLHSVSSIEIAETTKVVENCNRYLQIAFAEELYLYCQANDINFPELRDALNTKWNVNILEPREGIGGHCLPKGIVFAIKVYKKQNTGCLWK